MNIIVEILLLLLLGAYVFHRWATKNNDYFKTRGLPHMEPGFLYGNMKDLIFRKKPIFDIIKELYKCSGDRVFGVFDFRCPILLVRDPELIKKILVKDFDSFVNFRAVLGDHSADFFANSLFFMRDGKWRDMCNTLSPAFTDSKMRSTFELINQVAYESVQHLNDLAKDTLEIELDMNDFSTRFANDVIASTAFGLQTNSFKEKDNQFYVKGKQITNLTIWQTLKFFLFTNFTDIFQLFGLKVTGDGNTKYFMNLVLDAMKHRKEHNISRPDMINMLMETRSMIPSGNQKSHNREWTDIEILSQCFELFFAGFEATSVVVSFTAHELMENPEIQQRLFEEIDEASQQLNGLPLTYDVLKKMKYLDMIVSETLRKWPPALFVDRAASKDFVYEMETRETIKIEKGENIWIPVVGLHYDSQYYPNPKRFDPERFSEDNKKNLVPFTYLPFGLGPQNCIGSRFAMLEAKAMIFYIVRNFRIEVGGKSDIPINLLSNGFQLRSNNGFWCRLTSRETIVES